MAKTWIAAAALGGIILGLLLTPALEVRLTRRVVNPLLVSALFLALAPVLGNIASFEEDRGRMALLGGATGIVLGLGLSFATPACAKFALSAGQGSPTKCPEQQH